MVNQHMIGGRNIVNGSKALRVNYSGYSWLSLPLALCLTGCAVPKTGPVDWWHDMKGGAIAADRPAPPNAKAPYPNLAFVPPRPSISSASVRKGLTTSLVKERNHMNNRIAADAVPVTGDQPTTKKKANALGADKATNASADPTKPEQEGVTGAPVVPAAPTPSFLPEDSGATPAENPVATGPLPDLPNVPPKPPVLPGLVIPNPPAPSKPEPAAPATAPDATIQFEPKSAALIPSAIPALLGLAAERGSKTIQIIGGGDGGQDTAQTMLGLERAHAVWKALIGAGVPKSALNAQFLSSVKGVQLRLMP